MPEKRAVFRDVAAGAIIAAALILPMALPRLNDGAARVKVQVRTNETEPARVLTVETSKSVCTTAKAALSYGDPTEGAYTQINCGD